MPTLPTSCVTGKLECSSGTFTSAEDFDLRLTLQEEHMFQTERDVSNEV